jgi:hypothetical protein
LTFQNFLNESLKYLEKQYPTGNAHVTNVNTSLDAKQKDMDKK